MIWQTDAIFVQNLSDPQQHYVHVSFRINKCVSRLNQVILHSLDYLYLGPNCMVLVLYGSPYTQDKLHLCQHATDLSSHAIYLCQQAT